MLFCCYLKVFNVANVFTESGGPEPCVNKTSSFANVSLFLWNFLHFILDDIACKLLSWQIKNEN